MATTTNVSAAKPAVGGSMSIAPLGTALPTDATTALASDYVTLGYISEDGLTNSNTPETDSTKAWGGETVLSMQTAKQDTFGFTLLEVLNVDVLKFIYGDDNVSGTLDTGITVKATNDEPKTCVVVYDMIMRDGALKRIVIENGSLTELGDIAYSDSEATGFECTLTAYPNNDGVTHIEYIKRAA